MMACGRHVLYIPDLVEKTINDPTPEEVLTGEENSKLFLSLRDMMTFYKN